MSVYHLSAKSFSVSNGEVLADFYTEGKVDTILFVHAKWCGYCKKTSPEFVKASKLTSKVKFAMLEDVELKQMGKPLPVSGFPSFFRIDGKTGKISKLDRFPRVAEEMLNAI